jgi:magnesium transporter
MLINCIAYQDGRKLADIPISAIHDYITRPGCFVWVAFKDATDQELETMQREFRLHELAVEDAHLGHQRPKIEEYGDSIFAALHLIEVVDRDLHVGEIDVFAGPNYILSVRNRSKQNLIGIRDRCEREPHLLKQGTGFVLYALIDAVVDRYFPIIDGLETELEEIEDHIFDKGSGRASIERLYQLKQKVTIMKHAVLPLMEATGKLYGGRVPLVCANTQEYFRDVYDHLVRLNTTIDAIRETITTAIQVNLSMVTIEDNEVMKRLGAWAGILGSGVGVVLIGQMSSGLPGVGWRYAYAVTLVVAVAVCAGLYNRFKARGWL